MNASIIKVVEKSLNYVDPRLIDHGRRVAYLVYSVLRRRGGYDDASLGRLACLALLHDIGAYKTEEIDNMVHFESAQVWEHSIYGYLFISHFSPLADLAPAILFHHAGCNELVHLHPSLREVAQVIHVADRFDILTQTRNLKPAEFKAHFDRERGLRFDSAVLDLFFCSGWENIFNHMDEDRDFHRLLYNETLSQEQKDAFVSMIALIIDFRSAQTVTHTLTSTNACLRIAEHLDMSPEERAGIFPAAMLHDLGKMGTPLAILEKPGKLDAAERAVMEQHVAIGRDLLSDALDECTLLMAVRHHERLDGSGYPEGLTAKDLTVGQRLIGVADIYSALCSIRSYKDAYPKAKVMRIMEKMAADGLIDPDITAIARRHYDDIAHAVEKAVRPVLDVYAQIHAEYAALMRWVRSFHGPFGRIVMPPPLPGINERAVPPSRFSPPVHQV